MNQLPIEDILFGQRLYVDDQKIEFGNSSIRFQEIIDYDYVSYHANVNLSHYISVKIYLKSEKEVILIEYKPFPKLLRVGNNSRDIIDKLEKLMTILLPMISKPFIINTVQRIASGIKPTFANITFHKDHISMVQKGVFGDLVIIPYDDASILGNSMRSGLLYSGTFATKLILYNRSKNKEYAYSRNLNSQPSAVSINKAQLLLQYIKMTNPFENNNQSRNYFRL